MDHGIDKLIKFGIGDRVEFPYYKNNDIRKGTIRSREPDGNYVIGLDLEEGQKPFTFNSQTIKHESQLTKIERI